MELLINQTENAKDLPLPKYMSDGAAGMDLFANVADEVTIQMGEIKLIPTGIRIAMPVELEAQIRPRSGLALKYGITMINAPGTIDSDYRGEICVPLINFGREAFVVKRGERIAQMVINRVERITWVVTDTIDETERGLGGFGHTGR